MGSLCRPLLQPHLSAICALNAACSASGQGRPSRSRLASSTCTYYRTFPAFVFTYWHMGMCAFPLALVLIHLQPERHFSWRKGVCANFGRLLY